MTQMFSTTPDEFVVKMVHREFGFITGTDFPETRGPEFTSKGFPGLSNREIFIACSFMNMVIFNNAVRVAKERGLLNAVEVALCDEVLTILSEG